MNGRVLINSVDIAGAVGVGDTLSERAYETDKDCDCYARRMRSK